MEIVALLYSNCCLQCKLPKKERKREPCGVGKPFNLTALDEKKETEKRRQQSVCLSRHLFGQMQSKGEKRRHREFYTYCSACIHIQTQRTAIDITLKGSIIIAMATFQRSFPFCFSGFLSPLTVCQITTHKKKTQMDNSPTRRTLVARVRPPSVRPLHLLHFNLPRKTLQPMKWKIAMNLKPEIKFSQRITQLERNSYFIAILFRIHNIYIVVYLCRFSY